MLAQAKTAARELRWADAAVYYAASRTAEWTLENMLADDGAVFYQRRRAYTNRIPYVRWSVAWVFAALARLSAAVERGI